MGSNSLEHPPVEFLLIEDDASDSAMLAKALESFGQEYNLTVSASLQSAFEEHGARAVDLVLLDLILPDSTGLDAIGRCMDAWPDTPVVLLSGMADDGLAEEAVRAGAQDYLVKGHINARALCRALNYSIERHRSAQERRYLVAELEESRKLEAIGQLAAGVAHEINTPTQYVSDNSRFLRDAVSDIVTLLEAIRTYVEADKPVPAATLAELLEEADVEYLLEELPRAVDQSLDGLAHIARIVRAMKEFSHPASAEKVPTNLNRAVETTLVVASNEWKYVAEVTTDLDPDLPTVECLPGELNQVLLNLIVNAAHAIGDVHEENGDKGVISISSRVEGPNVEVRISDTGLGIPAEHRTKIFEPFFTTKEVGKGTGQGLAIAYNVVVKKHGGSISYEDTESGGATFVIQLPLRAGEQTQAAA